MSWRFGDLSIESSLPFDNLPRSAGAADIAIRHAALGDTPSTEIQQWTSHGGDVWLTIGQTDTGYRLSFPGLTCDISAAGREILFDAAADAEEHWIAHVLLHQVVPLAVTRLGRFVLHACAVQTPHGAIAFVGQSGSGKSTLAAAFCARGAALIADDALMLDVDGGDALAWPTADGVRLWNDMDWLVAGAPSPAERWAKMHVAVPLAPGPVPLVRMYETTYSRGPEPEISAIALAPFRLAVLSNLFRLDVRDDEESRRQFDRVHTLLARVPGRQLAFQDGERSMEAAYAAVMRDLQS